MKDGKRQLSEIALGGGRHGYSVASRGTVDDYGLPVGASGLRRFPTGPGSGDPGSTAAILLGMNGYQQWSRDMRERGQAVPAWEQGTPYGTESSADDIVQRLIEDDQTARQLVQSTANWREKFPDAHVPVEIDQLVREGQLEDVSWTSDSAPTFVRPGVEENAPQLIVQSVHPQDRKFADLGRFLVSENGVIEFDTEDMHAALSKLSPDVGTPNS